MVTESRIDTSVEGLSNLMDEQLKYWTVSENGDIDTTEAMDSSYPIPANRLTEMNWLNHIFSKVYEDDGVVKSEFYVAYFEALKNAGYKTIEFDTETISIKTTSKQEQ